MECTERVRVVLIYSPGQLHLGISQPTIPDGIEFWVVRTSGATNPGDYVPDITSVQGLIPSVRCAEALANLPIMISVQGMIPSMACAERLLEVPYLIDDNTSLPLYDDNTGLFLTLHGEAN